MLNAKKDAAKIFIKKQELKAQKAREERKTLQDIYIQEMVGITLKGTGLDKNEHLLKINTLMTSKM